MIASIIVPAFCARNTIGHAVATSLRQTLTDLEVIVIDDASRDGTAEAARSAARGDERVRVLRLPANQGVSAARNIGIDAARGDWIAVLDADDHFMPDRLESLIAAATAAGADIIADNLAVHWESGRYPDHLAFPARRMARRAPISAAAFAAADRPRWGLRAAGYMKPVIRRRFLSTSGVRYREDLRSYEDFHFYVQSLLAGAILRFWPTAGYVYTVRGGSLSTQDAAAARLVSVESNRLLRIEALARNDLRAAVALLRRERDLTLWNQCVDIRHALQTRNFPSALRTFWRMPSKTYALARFGEKASKDVAARFGRWAY